jgi:hypothetical protein
MDKNVRRRALLYLELAKSAQGRFHSRRNVEWKVSIGLWTLFGGATAGLLGAASWTPPTWSVIILVLVIVGILGVYKIKWLAFLAETFKRDQRTAYYWESGVQLLLGKKVPQNLDPGYRIEKGTLNPIKKTEWVRMEDCPMPDSVCGEKIDRSLHDAQKAQFYVTLGFAVLFVLVLLVKWLNGPQASSLMR